LVWGCATPAVNQHWSANREPFNTSPLTEHELLAIKAKRSSERAGQVDLERQASAVGAADRHLSGGAGHLNWPVDGIITSRFGIRGGRLVDGVVHGGRMHDGIDIAAPEGTKVIASEAGTVIYADNKQRGYGNMIMLKHDNGVVTIYAHNRENLVKEGDHVPKGQVIATVGQTGRADGPNLHFEVRVGVKPQNPLLYLPN
jgi:murein DD-endopeptidase MepM/ murein hydrolase activator NlpD